MKMYYLVATYIALIVMCIGFFVVAAGGWGLVLSGFLLAILHGVTFLLLVKEDET